MLSVTVFSLQAAAALGGWSLAAHHQGNDFFDGFKVVPENRNYVVWVNESEAKRLSLMGVNANTGRAFIRADHQEKVGDGPGRRAVRLESKERYSAGLFVLDATHMPQGCGSHYAWWMTGDHWPNSGEIDIVECINGDGHARHTLHTGANCDMAGADAEAFTGHWNGGNRFCNVSHDHNNGCSIISDDDSSCGERFNDLKTGGVFVTQLLQGSANNPARIASWFFRRDNVPADLQSDAPNPGKWGKPYALHPLGDRCTPDHFSGLWMTLSINFCGWAGISSQWDGADGCGAVTGSQTCEEWVGNNPAEFATARWDVNFVKVYQWQTIEESLV